MSGGSITCSPPSRWGSLDLNERCDSLPASFFLLASWFLLLPDFSSSRQLVVVTVCAKGPGSHSKCQLKWSNLAPEAHGELKISLGTDGPEHMPERISEFMSDSQKGWQIECQNRCQIECQIESQSICQKDRMSEQNYMPEYNSRWYVRNCVRIMCQGGGSLKAK